jgi:hypothetical protein
MAYQGDTMPYAHDPVNAAQEEKIRIPDGYTLAGISLRCTGTIDGGTMEFEKLDDGEAAGGGTNQLAASDFDLTTLTPDEETFLDYTALATAGNRMYITKAWFLARAVNLEFSDDTDALEVSPVFQQT